MENIDSDSIRIREVWNDNLDSELSLIRDIVDDYPYIAMDTEFPGIVVELIGDPKNDPGYNYRNMKANVELMKLIQLGLTFSDEKGNLPTCGTDKYYVWQFNFQEFNPKLDFHARDSITMLSDSGIDFAKNIEKGIDAKRLSELLMSSGVVLNDDVHWVTFHGSYDFGYLVKLLTDKNLPDTQEGFFEMISIFFPTIYDVRHLMNFCGGLYGGLSTLAESLGVKRVGSSHQAGSDSLLTCCTFLKLKEIYLKNSLQQYAGVLYRLNN